MDFCASSQRGVISESNLAMLRSSYWRRMSKVHTLVLICTESGGRTFLKEPTVMPAQALGSWTRLTQPLQRRYGSQAANSAGAHAAPCTQSKFVIQKRLRHLIWRLVTHTQEATDKTVPVSFACVVMAGDGSSLEGNYMYLCRPHEREVQRLWILLQL